MTAIGAFLNIVGLWLGWSMKQIWIKHDPDRALIAEECDYSDPMYDPNEFADMDDFFGEEETE